MVSSDGTNSRKQPNERGTIKKIISFFFIFPFFSFSFFFSLERNNFQINAGSKMLHSTVTKRPMQQTNRQKPDIANYCGITEQIPLFSLFWTMSVAYLEFRVA